MTRGIGRGAIISVALTAGLIGWIPGAHAAAGGYSGAVYTLTNSVAGNQILVFDRTAGGRLAAAGGFTTEGTGTGAGLGSQGALTVSTDGKWLFAVNAGSNTISSFQVGQSGVVLKDVVPSGGVQPISVTVHGNLLYTVNAGAGSNIAGFTVSSGGLLTPIAGSIQPLSTTNPGPADIQFSPDGQTLVVTEKGTNAIDSYLVGSSGIATPLGSITSAASTPFGFDFDPSGHLIVSDAGVGALSSYAEGSLGTLTLVSQVADFQAAPCWVAVSKNGKYVYTANAHNGTISGYGIAKDGSLTLLMSDGLTASPGGTPLDLSFTNNGQYLYLLNAGSSAIQGFSIAADGSLTQLASSVGVPASAAGIVAS
jgi:VCBS repeat-containing protein